MLVAQLCPTLCNSMECDHQAPLSIKFSRQEYWSGLPFPSPGVFPTQGLKLGLLHYRQFFPTVWATREVHKLGNIIIQKGVFSSQGLQNYRNFNYAAISKTMFVILFSRTVFRVGSIFVWKGDWCELWKLSKRKFGQDWRIRWVILICIKHKAKVRQHHMMFVMIDHKVVLKLIPKPMWISV